jgi:hypothetical protein
MKGVKAMYSTFEFFNYYSLQTQYMPYEGPLSPLHFLLLLACFLFLPAEGIYKKQSKMVHM